MTTRSPTMPARRLAGPLLAAGLLTASLLAASLLATVPAAGQEDPSDVVRAFYDRHAALSAEGGSALADPASRDEFLSPGLIDLLESDDSVAEAEGMGCLDFDPVYNGQDFDISDLAVEPAELDGEAAEVWVTFDNFGQPNELHYFLSNVGDGWRIDDISSSADDMTWSLADILACQA